MNVSLLEKCAVCGTDTEWDFDLGIEPLCVDCFDRQVNRDCRANYENWLRKNKERFNADRRERYRQNKDEINQYKQNWRKNHPENCKKHWQDQEAKRKELRKNGHVNSNRA